jgi:hypothetical protein
MYHDAVICKKKWSKSVISPTQGRHTFDACPTQKKFVPLQTLKNGHNGQTEVGGIPTY